MGENGNEVKNTLSIRDNRTGKKSHILPENHRNRLLSSIPYKQGVAGSSPVVPTL